MNMKDVKKITIPNPDAVILPSGYTQKTYISKTGGYGYIDLGITPTANTNIECTFEYSNTRIVEGNYSYLIFGACYGETFSSSTTNLYLSIYRSRDVYTEAKSLTIGYGNKREYAWDQFTSDTIYKFRNDGSNVYINDVLNTDLSSNSPVFNNTMGHLMIGACGVLEPDSSTSHIVGNASFKLYRFKVWENGVLIKDLVPAVRAYPANVGLYDLVNNEFITGNSFSSGDTIESTVEVKKIEDSNNVMIWGSASAFPYKLLEYIDIPANAYINLANNGNSNTKVKLDLNVNPDGTTSNIGQHLFGSIYYNGSTYYRYHMTGTSNGLIQAWFGTGNSAYKDTDIFSNNTQRHTYEINYVSNNTLYVDNVNKGTFTTPNTTNTGDMYLGARRFNNNGTVSVNNYNRKIRVYSVEVGIDTGSSIFYPVIRKSDNAVGLLKVYNNGVATRFCASETSTSLVAGPVAQEYWNYE